LALVERGIFFRSGTARYGNRDHRGRYLLEKWSERGHLAHLLGRQSDARISRNVAADNSDTQRERPKKPIPNRDRHDHILFSVNQTPGKGQLRHRAEHAARVASEPIE
jgi:hypothetical protein